MRKQGKKGFMLVFPLLGMQTELLCLHHPFHRQMICTEIPYLESSRLLPYLESQMFREHRKCQFNRNRNQKVCHYEPNSEEKNWIRPRQTGESLELPFRKQRLEAIWSIESYSNKEDANQVLLELAILDYNIVQSVYQRDLRETSRSLQDQNFLFLPRSRKQ